MARLKQYMGDDRSIAPPRRKYEDRPRIVLWLGHVVQPSDFASMGVVPV